MSLLVASLLAANLVQSAPPAQEAAPPQEVCLTNACSTAPKFETVAEAIQAGHGAAVRDMGGTPAQTLAALQRRLEGRLAAESDEGRRQALTLGLDALKRLADTSGGAQLRFGPGNGATTQTAVPVVGAVERVDAAGAVQRVMLLQDGGGLVTVANVQIPRAPARSGQ